MWRKARLMLLKVVYRSNTRWAKCTVYNFSQQLFSKLDVKIIIHHDNRAQSKNARHSKEDKRKSAI